MSRLTPSEMLVLLPGEGGLNSLSGDLSLLALFGCARVEQSADGVHRLSPLSPPDPNTWPPHLGMLHSALAAACRPLAGGEDAGEIGNALTSAFGGNTSTKAAFVGGFMPGTALYLDKVSESVRARGFEEIRPVRRLFGLMQAHERCRHGEGIPLGAAMDRRLEASAHLLPHLVQDNPPASVAAACAIGTLLIAGCMTRKYGPKIGAALMPLRDAAINYQPAAEPPPPFASQPGEEVWVDHAVPLPPQGVIAMVDSLFAVRALNIRMAEATIVDLS